MERSAPAKMRSNLQQCILNSSLCLTYIRDVRFEAPYPPIQGR